MDIIGHWTEGHKARCPECQTTESHQARGPEVHKVTGQMASWLKVQKARRMAGKQDVQKAEWPEG